MTTTFVARRRLGTPRTTAPAGSTRPRAARGSLAAVLALASVALVPARGASATPDPAAPDPASAASTAKPESPGSPMKAQLSSKFVVDYWNPEASVPGIKERNASPLEFGYFLQDLLDRAERARKDGDLPALIRFYRAVAKAVPENAKGWSKLCEAYELAKDRARAIRACRYAIERPAGDLEDYTRYVRLILGKDGPLSPEDKSELNGVLAHLEAQGTLELPVNQLRCEVGVKAKDLAMLETCTRALSRLAPDDARTVVFEWSLAVQKGQRSEARRLIERARKAGVVLESIERMEQVTSAASGWGRRGLGLLIALVILLAIGSGVYVTVRRRTLTQDVAR